MGMPLGEEAFQYDLLKESTAASFRREVGAEGDGWQALVAALQYSGISLPEEGAESTARRHLVDTYRSQTSEVADAIRAAKTALGGVFATLVGATAEKWPWYLHCLTFASHEPLEGSCVRFPVDKVDLQVLAFVMEIPIVLSQWLQPDSHFGPRLARSSASGAHLVTHSGSWAALLGPRSSSCRLREAAGLKGALVELKRGLVVENEGQVLSLKCEQDPPLGCIQDFSADEDVFQVSMPRHELRLPLDAVSKIVINQAGKELISNPLEGVPDNSLQWYCLQALVMLQARRRFLQLRRELPSIKVSQAKAVLQDWAGPAAANRESRAEEAVCSQNQAEKATTADPALEMPSEDEEEDLVETRYPLERVEEALQPTLKPSPHFVRAVAPFERDIGSLLPVQPADELQLDFVRDDWALCVELERKRKGWLPLDCVTIWEAMHPFRPLASWSKATYLPLQLGDAVVLRRRYEGQWTGWAWASCWTRRQSEGLPEGLVNLKVLRPLVLLSRSIPSAAPEHPPPPSTLKWGVASEQQSLPQPDSSKRARTPPPPESQRTQTPPRRPPPPTLPVKCAPVPWPPVPSSLQESTQRRPPAPSPPLVKRAPAPQPPPSSLEIEQTRSPENTGPQPLWSSCQDAHPQPPPPRPDRGKSGEHSPPSPSLLKWGQASERPLPPPPPKWQPLSPPSSSAKCSPAHWQPLSPRSPPSSSNKWHPPWPALIKGQGWTGMAPEPGSDEEGPPGSTSFAAPPTPDTPLTTVD